ncbi:Imidazolonepropionase [BD1-7 clade bacterium]|uniref:Imidazolonepropionase n=1 Tax=BD1-7 clade bacterium TaxID=2029982 RepID=A0A5S9NNR5_9GAMM|nr:Imidazolonepropionase [BD1-7 clade bacterium]
MNPFEDECMDANTRFKKRSPAHRINHRTKTAKGWMLTACASLLLSACGDSKEETHADIPDANNILFSGGTIISMANEDRIETVEAVWVSDGVIKMAGKLDTIKKAMSAPATSDEKDASATPASDALPDALPDDTAVIDLKGRTLMPGFIEPHGHIVLTTQLSQIADLAPCLPAKFEHREAIGQQKAHVGDIPCPVYIDHALDLLLADEHRYKGAWRVGFGIDPSRMNTNKTQPPSDIFNFTNSPANYIDNYLADKTHHAHDMETPVMMIDQSLHLAYVNRAAIRETLGRNACESAEKCPGVSEKKITSSRYQPKDPSSRYDYSCSGENICNYTGKLIEPGSYDAFFTTIMKQLDDGQIFLNESPDQFVAEAKSQIKALSDAGLTTFVNGGALSYDEVRYLKALVNEQTNDMRYISLMAWNASDSVGGAPMSSKEIQSTMSDIWQEGNGFLGVQGIKLWADGSTQGCSAWLTTPYAQNGNCSYAGTGHPNYANGEIIAEHLRPYFEAGNYINIHTNGDAASQASVNAFYELSEDCAKNADKNAQSACQKVHTLIHFTVDNQDADAVNAVKRLREKLDVTASHTIGHVAYWGAAFQGILDGDKPSFVKNVAYVNDPHGLAAMIDPIAAEQSADIPFSLHSDMPVTPARPLWLVEQALTRQTWIYPNLASKDAQPMPGNQQVQAGNQTKMADKKRMATYQALRAVTIEPARQHQLADKLGSIVVGKKADFVLLEKNPLDVAHDAISGIKVVTTFVDGQPVTPFDQDQ